MANTRQTWALILDSLYNAEQAEVRKNTGFEPDCVINRQDLTDDLDELSDSQINQTVSFLETNELLRQGESENGEPVYTLTQDGFSVAHNRHILQKQQSREQSRARNQLQVNRAIGYLTVGLLIATVLNPIMQYAGRPEYLGQSSSLQLLAGVTVVNLVVVGGIIYKLWGSGLLTERQGESSAL